MILSVTFILATFTVGASAGQYKEASTSSTLEEMKALVGTSSYAEYIEDYAEFVNPDGLVSKFIDVTNFIENNGDAYITVDSPYYLEALENNASAWGGFGDNANSSVYLTTINNDKKASSVSWNFTVTNEEVGLYFLKIEYYNCQTSESSVSAIQRKLLIDGKIPFSEVSSLTLDKHWSYNNYSDSEPTEAPAGATVGTTVTYEYIPADVVKGTRGHYNKYVTEVYSDAASGKLMQVVTTYTIEQDINGNSMAPLAEESSEWSTYICADKAGYTEGNFKFYLAEGTHTITLEAEREPVIIKSIEFVPAEDGGSDVISYRDYLELHSGKSAAGGSITVIEAEFPDSVSDASVSASNDNTSAITYPIAPNAQLFNVIGETGYDAIGQWATYKFTVNQSGMYNLSMRYKQNALQGMFICRSFKLAGGEYGLNGTPTSPFKEAENARFDYDSNWQSTKISGYVQKYDEAGNPVYDGNGNPVKEKTDYQFYFEAGVEYTLHVECALGDLKEHIQKVESTLANLNEAYLKIIQYTGADADANQDYMFEKQLPGVLVTLIKEAINLTEIADELERECGTNGAHISTLDTVARLLNTMGKNYGKEIAANLSTFKSYLGTLGTWINSSKQGTMMVDSICIVPVNTTEQIPYASANFFQSIWFEICSFIYSFFTDYNQMGVTSLPEEGVHSIDVWLASGRDQSQIWRSMLDAEGGFTDRYGTAVSLKLVTGGTLLPSILSGKGPDVYLGFGAAEVINYAIREAIIGVSGNDPYLTDEQNAVFSNYIYKDASGKTYKYAEPLSDADAAAQGLTLVSNKFEAAIDGQFAPAAMKTLTIYSPLNEGKENADVTYGIPMTMGFPMMFYRMDILAELNQEVPETWDQLLEILPVLQANNMDIGVTYVLALDFMMYQMGGSMWKYTDQSKYDSKWAGAKIDLDSDIALEAFDFVCRLYTDYSFPVSFDIANRFRTGEMPITVGDYATVYNTLVIYATDISGLWEFSSIPGSFDKDTGAYNYDSLATVTATIILRSCLDGGDQDLLPSWQFTQWQTSADVQSNYGNRIVALIGPAAKYETANINAIEDLSWTANEKAAIRNQMDHLDAIVNYPGSYIYARYMKFAFLDVYNEGAKPHDAMMDYIDAINSEISRKREEFGLPSLDKNASAPTKG
ncbi:MAG: extracellular solute-binding protein [Clostridia bacterium]|nr:extracellular solute-binding protein [Clostridia bacterium]